MANFINSLGLSGAAGPAGPAGKGDISGRPFCEAEIQAFPLSLKCHCEAP